MLSEDFCTTRPLRDDDINLILSSWLKCHRRAKATDGIPNEIYFAEHKKIALSLLRDCESKILCNRQDDDQVYGYIVYSEPRIVHYVFLKKEFQHEFGLLEGLLRAADMEGDEPIFCTHWSHICEQQKKRTLIHNPYILRYLLK